MISAGAISRRWIIYYCDFFGAHPRTVCGEGDRHILLTDHLAMVPVAK
jgi:hypothetical protein